MIQQDNSYEVILPSNSDDDDKEEEQREGSHNSVGEYIINIHTINEDSESGKAVVKLNYNNSLKK